MGQEDGVRSIIGLSLNQKEPSFDVAVRAARIIGLMREHQVTASRKTGNVVSTPTNSRGGACVTLPFWERRPCAVLLCPLPGVPGAVLVRRSVFFVKVNGTVIYATREARSLGGTMEQSDKSSRSFFTERTERLIVDRITRRFRVTLVLGILVLAVHTWIVLRPEGEWILIIYSTLVGLTPLIWIILGIIYTYKRARISDFWATAVPNIPEDEFEKWKRLELKSIDIFLWSAFGSFLLYIFCRILLPAVFEIQMACIAWLAVGLVVSAVYGTIASRRKKKYGIVERIRPSVPGWQPHKHTHTKEKEKQEVQKEIDRCDLCGKTVSAELLKRIDSGEQTCPTCLVEIESSTRPPALSVAPGKLWERQMSAGLGPPRSLESTTEQMDGHHREDENGPEPETSVATTFRRIRCYWQSKTSRQKQHIVLWLGVLIVVIMCLFPPWMEHYRWGPRSGTFRSSIGYECILSPPRPDPSNDLDEFYVDIPRLLLQCGVVALLTGAGMYTLRTKGQLSDGLGHISEQAGSDIEPAQNSEMPS